ncbi:universal stress protein [Streptomyces sp. NPDC088354]|uniref:universal stress protein n=1 Tax=unclassified Streptomyces TaxID=2593676 RepID=UPI0037FE275B
MAAINGRTVYVVHAEESAVSGESGAEGEDLESARTAVRTHLDRLAAQGVPAVGHVLRHATGHGEIGRLIAEHAEAAGARAIVIGAPTHGGLCALMDASAGRELMRRATCDIVLINPRAAEVGAAA